MEKLKNKTYSLILGTKYDAEIVGKLEEMKSKAGYIKELVKKDIAGELNSPDKFDEKRAIETIKKYSKITEEKYEEGYLNNSEITITCACSYSKYMDIINKMDSIENKSEYIKQLILIDMGLIDADDKRFMLPGVEEEGQTRARKKDDKRLETQREYAKRSGYAANKRYEEKNGGKFKTFNFNCNIKYDADVVEKLNTVSNKAKYIKMLILKDIQGE